MLYQYLLNIIQRKGKKKHRLTFQKTDAL